MRIRTSILLLLIFFFLLQLLAALFLGSGTLSFDESMWHYIGRNWFTRGLVPYEGGIDNKSPFIFAIFGLSDWLFGLNIYFPRILGIIFQTAGIYLVYKIGVSMGNEQMGKFAMIIYGCSLLWASTGGHLVSGTESYEIFFLLLSIYFTAKLRRALSGFVGAVAIGFRLSAIFGLIALFFYRRGAESFVKGLLIGIILIPGIFWIAGIDLKELLQYTVLDNFGKGSVTSHSFSWKLNELFNNFFLSHMLLLLPGLFFYLLMKKRSNFVLTWFLLEFLGICLIGLFARQHFKQLLPALALMNGFVAAHFYERARKLGNTISVALWILFFPFFEMLALIPFKTVSRYGHPCAYPSSVATDSLKRAAGLHIKAISQPEDKVLVAGFGAIVQAYSDRLSPSIYFNVTQTEAAKRRFFSDVRSHPPKFLAVPKSNQYKATVLPEIRNFVDSLSRSYDSTGCVGGYNIFIRRN